VVSRAGRAIPLTPREFTLLELLARSSPRVVTRQAILEGVWGYHSEVSANNVEAFVSALRSKIDTAGGLKLIHTIRGVGYCLKEEVS
jgi:DNA-binding response OmpR family regulator